MFEIHEHVLHAHVEREVSDGETKTLRQWRVPMLDEEQRSEFAETDFKGRVMADTVSFSHPGTLLVTEFGLNWTTLDDEGYAEVEVRWCEARH